tara:strand:+ start:10 stop:381 length:372 start_codon:yes stop_codon:yes gene_type:complete
MILGELLGPATKLLDKFIPDADEKQRIAYELSTLAERHAQEQALSQIELNKQEAKGNWFQSSWRPAIGHVCWIGLAYNVIVQPILSVWLQLPPVNSDLLYPVMLGMLGMSGIRGVEKVKGVAK